MRRTFRYSARAPVTVLLIAVQAASRLVGSALASETAQFEPGISGQLQTDVRAGQGLEGGTGLNFYASELRLRADINPRLHFWGAGEVEHEEGAYVASLKEAYLALTDRDREYRFGRFRVPFGIVNREEVEYAGFIDPPLVKSESVRGFQLGRVDTGLMVSAGQPSFRYEAAVVNGTGSNTSVDNNSSKDLSLRMQSYHRNLIVGANFYDGRVRDTSAPTPVDRRVHQYGVDWRYTIPNLLLRGEWIRGRVGGQGTRGWHADLLYHTPSMENLTLLARYEQFDPDGNAGGDEESRWTVGARHFFRPDITVALNCSWEHNVETAHNKRVEIEIIKTVIF